MVPHGAGELSRRIAAVHLPPEIRGLLAAFAIDAVALDAPLALEEIVALLRISGNYRQRGALQPKRDQTRD
jgi:hypothetical protein